MNKSQIIKDPNILAKWELEIRKRVRQEKFNNKQYLFFLLALGTGLQIDELQSIKFMDLRVENMQLKSTGRPKEVMYISLPSKRNPAKTREIIFPDQCKKMALALRDENPNDIYLFQNKAPTFKNKPPAPWSSNYIYQFLAESAEACKFPTEYQGFGSTMLRKTFGYMQLKYEGWTLRDLQQYFEMRSINLVKEYLGLTDDEKFD